MFVKFKNRIAARRCPLRASLFQAALLFLSTHVISAPAYALDVDKPAPALRATMLDGKIFDVAANRGHVIIVNFWASFCVPCRHEMPLLDAYYQQHYGEGLRMLAISVDDPEEDDAVREIMRAYHFPAAFIRNANVEGYGRIRRMPMTFVIDRDGILRRDGSVGTPTIDMTELDRVVTPLLGKPVVAPVPP